MALFTPLSEVRALAVELEANREALVGCAMAVHAGRDASGLCGRAPASARDSVASHLAWHAEVCRDGASRLGDAVLAAEGGEDGVREARRVMDESAWRSELRLHALCVALEAEQEALHAAWDRAADIGYEAPEGDALGSSSGFHASRDTVEVGGLLTAARNMARVAYAPPGWRLGMPLPGDSKPPAPAEADLVVSLLHLPLPGDGEAQVERLEAAEREALGGEVGVSKGFLGLVQRRERDAWASNMDRLVDAAVRKQSDMVAQTKAAAGQSKSRDAEARRGEEMGDVHMVEEAQPTAQTRLPSLPVPPPMPAGWKPGDAIVPPPMPAGWKPGDPVPLPPMPAGWKPGDPVPLPPPMPPGWKPGDALPTPGK